MFFLLELYRPDVLDDLMKESEVVVNRRKECIKMIGALEKANEVRFSPTLHFPLITSTPVIVVFLISLTFFF